MIEEQNRMAHQMRHEHLRKLAASLASLGYHVVLAVTVDDVELRLAERELPDFDFDTMNYVALQTAMQLSDHTDIIPVDEAIDEAIDERIAINKKAIEK